MTSSLPSQDVHKGRACIFLSSQPGLVCLLQRGTQEMLFEGVSALGLHLGTAALWMLACCTGGSCLCMGS